MNNKAIGVFDSGLGGLTAVKELNKLMPNEDIIYLGDTARVPYGGRSKETLIKYAKEDFDFLEKYDLKMIIVACGTVSSLMMLNDIYDGDKLTTEVLSPAVKAAVKATKNKKIGVIGTSFTIKSKGYDKAIHDISPEISVYGKACPMFVPLVENGYIDVDNEVLNIIANEYLKEVIENDVDTLILGCTHYPIIKDVIGKIMGDKVTLISPGEEAAKFALSLFEEKNMLSGKGKGENKYFVTDSVEMFTAISSVFLGTDVKESVFRCEL